MKLRKESIEWAISHILLKKDTDLFPALKEIEIFTKDEKTKNDVIDTLSNIDIGNYLWQPYRKYTIPKSEFSYRVATQLDPIDNILFAAIIYEYGNKIESKRIDKRKIKFLIIDFRLQRQGCSMIKRMHGKISGRVLIKRARIMNM